MSFKALKKIKAGQDLADIAEEFCNQNIDEIDRLSNSLKIEDINVIDDVINFSKCESYMLETIKSRILLSKSDQSDYIKLLDSKKSDLKKPTLTEDQLFNELKIFIASIFKRWSNSFVVSLLIVMVFIS